MRSLKDNAVQQALQLPRMFFHVMGALLVGGTYLIAQATRTEALWCLVPVASIFAVLDLLRLFIRPWREFCAERYTGVFMRPDERARVSGMTFSFAGMVAVIMMFPRDIAAVGILFEGFIDPAARFVGVLWGRIRIGNLKKTIMGTLGGLAAALIVAASVALHTAPALPFVALISGGISASAIEIIGGDIDNFLIPITASAVMAAFT